MDAIEKKNDSFTGQVIKRTIRAGAEDAVISNSTKYFYQDGINSSIREIASNSRDSQIEKRKIIEVLEGRVKFEDYFTDKQGKDYEDSKIDLNYYDLKWLDKSKNFTEIIYKHGGDLDKKDTIEFIDYGVGLGMPRLEGYFSLGLKK